MNTECLSQELVSQLLEDCGWVDDLMRPQIEQLSLFFNPYTAEANAFILKEGEENHAFYILCNGYVDIVKENTSGKVKTLQTIGPGKVFGEMAFFDHGASSASVIVKEQALLLIMSEENFNALCIESPYLALVITIKLVRAMSSRLRETSGKLIDFL